MRISLESLFKRRKLHENITSNLADVLAQIIELRHIRLTQIHIGYIHYKDLDHSIQELYSLFLLTEDKIIYILLLHLIEYRIKLNTRPVLRYIPYNSFVSLTIDPMMGKALVMSRTVLINKCPDLLYNFPGNNYIPLWIKLGIRAPSPYYKYYPCYFRYPLLYYKLYPSFDKK